MSNLVKNSAIYALGDIIPRLFGFITFPILTSYLIPAEYGIINYVNTLNLFLIVFSVLCINTYYLVFYYRQPNVEAQKALLGNLTIFILGITLLLSLIAYLLGFYYDANLTSEITFYPYIAIGIGINFFSVFSVLPMALFRVQERPLPLTIINIVKGGLILVLTLVLVVVYDYKALGVLMATLIVNVFFAAIFIFVTYKNAIFRFDWKQLKKALIFSLPLVPGSLAYYLVAMSDRILIEKFVNLDSLGIYSTASTLALLLNIISSGAYKAFEPYFFKIYGSDIFEKQFQKVHDTYLFILLIGASGLALFSKEFFVFFASEKYHEAYYFVPMILVGVLASSVSLLYGTIITAREQTKLNSLISIIGGVCSVVLNVLLLPHLGILASCITSSLCFVGMMMFSFYFSKVKISLKRGVMTFVFVAILCIYLVYFLQIDNIYNSIAVKVIAEFLICIVCLYLLKLRLSRLYGTIFN